MGYKYITGLPMQYHPSPSFASNAHQLLTPPSSHFPNHPTVTYIGIGKNKHLHHNTDKHGDFRLICNYLFTNDPVMKIINNE